MLKGLLDCAARDPEQARKGWWLNWLLLAFIVLNCVLVVVSILGPPSAFVLADSITLLLLVGLYILNRRGFVSVVAVTLVVLCCLAVAGGCLISNASLSLALVFPAFFVVAMLASGVFLSWRAVPLVGLLCVIFSLWYYLASNVSTIAAYRISNPDSTVQIATSICMLMAGVGALSWLSSRLLRQALVDLRRRNTDLEAAYNELAAQTQRERDLGVNIGDLAVQLSQVSNRQSTGVSSQARSISEVVSVVAELHAAADQIAARAEEVRQAADSALRSVQRGQELVVRSREAVQRNRTQVQVVIERMAALDQLTARINQFVNRIRGLSDETHLLALNATIEAAGAGPLGRRFSVVASEVQNLSKRSNEIVDQIRTLINELQLAGQVTLSATQSSIEVANEVEALADEVRNAQEQVVEAVQRTTELVHLISTATNQQTSATAQMTHTMQEIAQVADTTNSDTGALERAISELIDAANLLNSAMASLRGQPQPQT
jgi:methyl-accepting chemotaxis protein